MIRRIYPLKRMLSPKTCEQILRECHRAGDYEASRVSYEINPDLRSSSSIHVPRSVSRVVFNNVMDLFYAANRFYGFEVYHDVQMELIRYDSDTKDKFDWHTDDLPEDDAKSDRKLSMSIQLSDFTEYSGCDLEIEGFDDLEFRDQGSVMVFPSYMKHRVTPCTRGTRHVLVAWMYGPEWR